MMKFYWDPKYSVNIKSIDIQHKKFFEIINNVFFLLRQKPVDETKVNKIVKDLVEYAEYHLNYEEKCFKETDYPDMATHCQFHNGYRQKIKDYQKKIKQKDSNLIALAQEIAEFAQNWLSEHILATDQKYSQYFLVHDVE